MESKISVLDALKSQKTGWLVLGVMVLLCLILSIFFINLHSIRIFEVKEIKKTRINVQFNAVAQNVRHQADLIFSELINKPEYLRLMAAAVNSRDDFQKDMYRKQLFNTLNPLYKRLLSIGIKQLHFHEANNDSFLRMHKPDKFGDNLTKIRSTIAFANKTETIARGFEEGRIFNGFRNVYPLYSNEKHIGSVEISYSASSLMKMMNELFPGTIDFIIGAEVVGDKVFVQEKSNYKISPLSPDFLIESNRFTDMVLSDNRFDENLLAKINSSMAKEYGAKLYDYRREVYPVKVNGDIYTISALPLINFDGEPIGYFIRYEDGGEFKAIDNAFLREITLLIVVGVSLLGAYFVLLIGRCKLVAKQKQLELALETRSRFLRSMSHELRTPLNGIIGFAEILHDNYDHPDRDNFLGLIIHAGKSLLQLINDILDTAKFQSVGVKVEFADFSTKKLFEHIVEFFESQAHQKGIKVLLEFGKDFPEVLHGDVLRLQQILVNLIGNSIKFTEKGYVKLKARCIEKSGQLWLEVICKDTGKGMAPDELDKIFEEFHQAQGQSEMVYGGTGLGLSIVKRIIDAMNGKVDVASELGKGSEFTVLIPVKHAESTIALEDDYGGTEHEEPFINGRKVLIVEDNQINSLYLTELLKPHGAIVSCVSNGKEALDYLENNKVDLILMDVNMPIMNGYQASERIRELEDGKENLHRIIIGVTAGVLDEEISACYDAGMDKVIRKPIQRKELFSTLNSFFIGMESAEQELSEENKEHEKPQTEKATPGIDDSELEYIDMQFLHRNIPGSDMPEIMRKVIQICVKDTIPGIRGLENVVEDKNITVLNQDSHRLKGALMYLGCEKIIEKLYFLEHVETIEEAKPELNEVLVQVSALEQECKIILDRLG